jgi:hypothetical protein
VEPYKNMPVIYAQGTLEWVKAMKYYINNESARYDDGKKLNEFCNLFYNYSSINNIRKDIFHETREQAGVRSI